MFTRARTIAQSGARKSCFAASTISSTVDAIFIRTSEAYCRLLRPLVVLSTQAVTYSPCSTNHQSHLLLEDHGLIGDLRSKYRPGNACDSISFVGLRGRWSSLCLFLNHTKHSMWYCNSPCTPSTISFVSIVTSFSSVAISFSKTYLIHLVNTCVDDFLLNCFEQNMHTPCVWFPSELRVDFRFSCCVGGWWAFEGTSMAIANTGFPTCFYWGKYKT